MADPLAPLQPWRDRHRRTAWRPVIGLEGPALEGPAHFGGAPRLASGEPWPACRACGRALTLVLQLDLDALPAELAGRHGSGLLQVFYCTARDCGELDAEGWLAFSDAHLLRIVDPTVPGAEPAPPPGAFPRIAIAGWEPFDDWPSPEDHRPLGLVYDYDFAAKTVRVSWPERGVSIETRSDAAERIADAAKGDKLSGWPDWRQRAEYPDCPRCGVRMAFVFQIASRDHLRYLWGDVGTAYVTQCPEHVDVLAICWAC